MMPEVRKFQHPATKKVFKNKKAVVTKEARYNDFGLCEGVNKKN